MKTNKVLIALALTLPLAGAKAITFTSDTFIGVGDTTYDGQGIAVSNCTLTVDGPHAFASLEVQGSGVVTHPPGYTTGTGTNRVELTIAGNVMIAAGAAISADGCGYGTMAGPGAGAPACDCFFVGGGGGHGGLGGSSGCGAGGAAYGSLTQPLTWGSGGGRSCNPTLDAGRGGGAIRLVVGGTLTLDGRVSARGQDSTLESGVLGGGGAGGSVWITASNLTGTGSVSVNGGAALYDWNIFRGGGGASGRIAVYYSNGSFAGNLSAIGGAGWVAGGAGTVFVRDTRQPLASVRLYNGWQAGALTPLTTPERVDLLVQGGAKLYPEAALQLGAFTLGEGCQVYRPGGDAPPAAPVIQISASGNVVLETNSIVFGNCLLDAQGNLLIAAGAAVSADALGYPGMAGPGAGAPTCDTFWVGGGGGHGAWGGSSGCGAGGTAYGSITEPTTWGSGGGRPANPTITAGAGGGAIRLIVGGTLTLDGKLTARGEDGMSYPGGGGAGGSIWITAGSLAGSGAIATQGGAANPTPPAAGGGGAGGRIAVYFGSTTFSGAMAAPGGIGWVTGGAGSVFTKNTAQPIGTLVVDNAGKSGAITPVTTEQRFNLTIRSAGRVEPTAPLVVGDLFLASGCQIYHAPSPTAAVVYDVQIAASGNVVLETNSVINANSFLSVEGNLVVPTNAAFNVSQMGFGSAGGPGAGQSAYLVCPGGWCSYCGGGGGGHGNYGQNGGIWPVSSGGNDYGSEQEPAEWGSGGGLGDWMHRWPDAAGAGGGAVRLIVGGTATVNGSLLADGGSGNPDIGSGGGGAGGSLWLTAARLEGSGLMSVNWGAGTTTNRDGAFSANGAGGRVAIYATDTNAWTGHIHGVRVDGQATLDPVGTVFRTATPVGTSIAAVAPTNRTSGAVSFIRVTFRQGVRSGTFTADDVVLTAPGGVVPSAQLSVVQVSPLVFDIRCPAQTALGGYTVQIGPHISDLYGNEMGYVSTSTFTLTLLALTATSTGQSLVLSWPSNLGQTYQLQSTTNLSGGVWQYEGPSVAGTGGVMTNGPISTAEPQRFFRLRAW